MTFRPRIVTTACALVVATFVLGASAVSAQVDPVQLFPLPGGHTWTAIPGAANMDSDPADEIVLVNEDQQLVIVDSATGEVQFDSAPYQWVYVLAPGWNREGTSTYHLNHGYDVFCDEDGDGIYCLNVLVAVSTPYEYQLAVICLDRGAASVPSGASSSQLQLRPNAPNPLNTSTRIGFSLARSGRASVLILDAQGRRVRSLLDQELPAGDHSIVWDGRNDSGGTVANGMYYYELQANGERSARKAVLLR